MIFLGKHIEISTRKQVVAWLCDGEIITLSETLDVGARGCGEAGLWPSEAFNEKFRKT